MSVKQRCREAERRKNEEDKMTKRKKLTKGEKKEVYDLIKEFKKHDLMEDRSEYDVDDLKSTYPHLSKSQSKLLFELLQKWRKR